MINANLKTTLIDRGWGDVTKTLKALNRSNVEVGVFEDTAARDDDASNIVLAAVHEFGSPSKNIPQRSFIRSAYDKNLKKINKLKLQLLEKIYNRKMNSIVALNILGQTVREMTKKRMIQLRSPKLKPLTLQRKLQSPTDAPGFPTPLIHTGQLLKAITFKVKRNRL